MACVCVQYQHSSPLLTLPLFCLCGAWSLLSGSSCHAESNALTGEVPPRLIVDWPKLYEFNIRDNKLTGELPDAWGGWRANIAPDHFMHALLVDSNQFSGLVPKSWRTFEGKLLRLDLYDNAELSGCVPLSTATTVAAKGTKLSSPNCKTDGASIEVTQRAALRRYLPLFLSKNTTKSRNDTIERVLVEMDKLGSILKPGQISTSISISDAVNPDTNFWIFVDLVDGAEMVKMLWIQYFGMDTRYLAPLARGLPGLKDLVCDYCFYYRGPPGDPALLLPEDLPEAAPQCGMRRPPSLFLPSLLLPAHTHEPAVLSWSCTCGSYAA
jgi:hypothetical protein